jgi:hypothetical protein
MIGTHRVEAEINTKSFGKVSITVRGRHPIQNKGAHIIIDDACFIRVQASSSYWPLRPYTGTVVVSLKKNCNRNPMEVVVNKQKVEIPFLS